MEWIGVKDRLPEKDGWHLVFAPGYWGNRRIYGIGGMVTHWMPLPEPPKEE